MAFTAATDRLIRLADELDLNHITEAPYRGAIRVALNGGHQDAGTGSIFIGATTGRVLHMTLRHGSDDPRPRRLTRHVGYRAARTALIEYGRYARRMGLIPEPQDPGHVPAMSDEDLAGLADALLAERPAPAPQPMTVMSGRATWHRGVVRVLAPA